MASRLRAKKGSDTTVPVNKTGDHLSGQSDGIRGKPQLNIGADTKEPSKRASAQRGGRESGGQVKHKSGQVEESKEKASAGKTGKGTTKQEAPAPPAADSKKRPDKSSEKRSGERVTRSSTKSGVKGGGGQTTSDSGAAGTPPNKPDPKKQSGLSQSPKAASASMENDSGGKQNTIPVNISQRSVFRITRNTDTQITDGLKASKGKKAKHDRKQAEGKSVQGSVQVTPEITMKKSPKVSTPSEKTKSESSAENNGKLGGNKILKKSSSVEGALPSKLNKIKADSKVIFPPNSTNCKNLSESSTETKIVPKDSEVKAGSKPTENHSPLGKSLIKGKAADKEDTSVSSLATQPKNSPQNETLSSKVVDAAGKNEDVVGEVDSKLETAPNAGEVTESLEEFYKRHENEALAALESEQKGISWPVKLDAVEAGYLAVLGKDYKTTLPWPTDLVVFTKASPALSYSVNPLSYDFKSILGKDKSKSSGRGTSSMRNGEHKSESSKKKKKKRKKKKRSKRRHSHGSGYDSDNSERNKRHRKKKHRKRSHGDSKDSRGHKRGHESSDDDYRSGHSKRRRSRYSDSEYSSDDDRRRRKSSYSDEDYHKSRSSRRRHRSSSYSSYSDREGRSSRRERGYRSDSYSDEDRSRSKRSRHSRSASRSPRRYRHSHSRSRSRSPKPDRSKASILDKIKEDAPKLKATDRAGSCVALKEWVRQALKESKASDPSLQTDKPSTSTTGKTKLSDLIHNLSSVEDKTQLPEGKGLIVKQSKTGKTHISGKPVPDSPPAQTKVEIKQESQTPHGSCAFKGSSNGATSDAAFTRNEASDSKEDTFKVPHAPNLKKEQDTPKEKSEEDGPVSIPPEEMEKYKQLEQQARLHVQQKLMQAQGQVSGQGNQESQHSIQMEQPHQQQIMGQEVGLQQHVEAVVPQPTLVPQHLVCHRPALARIPQVLPQPIGVPRPVLIPQQGLVAGGRFIRAHVPQIGHGVVQRFPEPQLMSLPEQTSQASQGQDDDDKDEPSRPPGFIGPIHPGHPLQDVPGQQEQQLEMEVRPASRSSSHPSPLPAQSPHLQGSELSGSPQMVFQMPMIRPNTPVPVASPMGVQYVRVHTPPTSSVSPMQLVPVPGQGLALQAGVPVPGGIPLQVGLGGAIRAMTPTGVPGADALRVMTPVITPEMLQARGESSQLVAGLPGMVPAGLRPGSAPLQGVQLQVSSALGALQPGNVVTSAVPRAMVPASVSHEALQAMQAAGGVVPAGALPAGAIPVRTPQAGAIPPGALPAGAIPAGAIPAGAIPAGAIPAGAIPAGAIPGAIPAGAIQAGAVPAGVLPSGAMPAGAIPAGALPAGAVPAGAVPAGAVPVGALPAGALPVGALPPGAVPARALAAGGIATGGIPAGAIPASGLQPGIRLAAIPRVPGVGVPTGAIPVSLHPGAVQRAALPVGLPATSVLPGGIVQMRSALPASSLLSPRPRGLSMVGPRPPSARAPTPPVYAREVISPQTSFARPSIPSPQPARPVSADLVAARSPKQDAIPSSDNDSQNHPAISPAPVLQSNRPETPNNAKSPRHTPVSESHGSPSPRPMVPISISIGGVPVSVEIPMPADGVIRSSSPGSTSSNTSAAPEVPPRPSISPMIRPTRYPQVGTPLSLHSAEAMVRPPLRAMAPAMAPVVGRPAVLSPELALRQMGVSLQRHGLPIRTPGPAEMPETSAHLQMRLQGVGPSMHVRVPGGIATIPARMPDPSHGGGPSLPPGAIRIGNSAVSVQPGMTGAPPGAIGLPPGAVRLPQGAVGLPPGAAGSLPHGAVRLPAGAVRLPPGAVGMPPGAIRLPPGAVRLPPGAAGIHAGAAGLPVGGQAMMQMRLPGAMPGRLPGAPRMPLPAAALMGKPLFKPGLPRIP
ncbi:uncharacterized protein [Diadema antillarum]|uniref:uncharacterized protein isoform X1 n=1 Tax=Diadema antillarum TaxID=105358 RepID=UPI003A84041D